VLVFDVAPLPSRTAAAAATGGAAAAGASSSPSLVPSPPPSASLRGHPRLRDVSSLAWRPCRGRELAVGVAGGVLLWKGGGGSGGDASPSPPPPPRCLFFPVPRSAPLFSLPWSRKKSHLLPPVSALAWSPDGRLLAGAVAGAAGIVVWEAATGAAQRVAPAAAVAAVAAAPLSGSSPLAALVGRVVAGVSAAAAAAPAAAAAAGKEGTEGGGGGGENDGNENDTARGPPAPPAPPPPPPPLLSWSPCGGRLFASSGGRGGGGFTVFETERWEASVWEAPPAARGGGAERRRAASGEGPAVVGACWSPSGDSVLVALSDPFSSSPDADSCSASAAVLASLAFVAPPPALGAQLLPVPLPPGTAAAGAAGAAAAGAAGAAAAGAAAAGAAAAAAAAAGSRCPSGPLPAALAWDPTRAARLALVLLDREPSRPSVSVAVLLAEAAPVLAPRLVGVASLPSTSSSPFSSSSSSSDACFSAARAEFAPVAPEGGFGRRGALLAVRGCRRRVALLPLGL